MRLQAEEADRNYRVKVARSKQVAVARKKKQPRKFKLKGERVDKVHQRVG